MKKSTMIPATTKSKIAVFADLHLGVHSNSGQWHNIALEWVQWFKASLKSNDIKDIIFCGDWHHNRSEISVDTLNVSAAILKELQEFNLYLIVGNHDAYYKNRIDVHSLNVFQNRSNVHIIDSACKLITKGKTIHFLPWGATPSELEGPADICFGHLEIESFKMNSLKECDDGIKITELLEKYRLVLSGHFHHRHTKQFSNGCIMYVGNPFQMDFGDCDNQKGYYILDLEDLGCNFIPNTISPRHIKTSLSQLVAVGSITDDVHKMFQNNFINFSVDKNISQEHSNILLTKLNALSPAGLVVNYDAAYNRILNKTQQEVDFSGIDITQAIEEYVNLLDIENKQTVIQYTLDLYNRCS